MNNLFFKKISKAGIFLAFLLLILSCKTQKEAVRRGPLGHKTTQALITKLQKNEFRYDWLSLKASTEVHQDNKKNTFRAAVRMRKDSMIWISVSPLMGVEVARVTMTPDTVMFLNRLSNTYFIGNFEYLNELFSMDIDFDVIQSLIIGNSIGIVDEEERLKTSTDNEHYLISNFRKRRLRKQIEKSRLDDLLHSVWLEPDSFKIARMAIHDLRLDKSLIANYQGFHKIESQLFPKKATFTIKASQPLIIETEFSKIEINQELSFPFKIPDKYVQVH